MKQTILVVDDEKDIVDSLERQFRRQYHILKATSGIEALRVLNQNKVQLILSDQRMPEMTGVQLFERAQKTQPDAIRILLTGYTDVESVIAAINNGQIYRYVTKPWDPRDLDLVVQKALETYDLRSELRKKNEALSKALAELQVLDQAKNHFMVLIGHELKTPLTSLRSFLDLLKEEKLSTDATQYVGRIDQSTNRLIEIVFDVLDIMGAETGQTGVSSAKVRISDLIQEVTSTLQVETKKKSLTIKTTDGGITWNTDRTMLSKSLKKVIHNAVKFGTPDSSVKIEVTGTDIKITNSGETIPSEKIEILLRPFTLDEDVMHHHQGLGLGLAVANSLVRRMGGALQIESKGGVTTVTISNSPEV